MSKTREVNDYLVGADGNVMGFIRVNIKNGLPHLQHMYLDMPYRNLNNTRELIKKFTAIVRDMKHKEAYLHATTYRQARLIQYYFRTNPYAVKDGIVWFKVNISQEK